MAFFRADFMSQELGMHTSANIMIPDGMDNRKLKVLYLLHGLSDNCSCWNRLTSVERYAREYHLAVIMPEVQRSFYTDMKHGMKYFSYITKELPRFVHSMFNLPVSREKTYVAGLSMGGYGALKCALTYPNRYAACAAFSSCCDMQYNVDSQRISNTSTAELMGVFGMDLQIGKENDLFALAQKCARAKEQPVFYMSCGTLDSLLHQNHELRDHMRGLGLDLNYEEWEDDHTWRFWDASLQRAFAYFFGEKTGGVATPLSDGR